MRSVRDTGLVFPSTLTNDEKHLKELFEKLRNIRKAIAATNKINVNATVGDNLKTERKTTKRHLQQAEEATEEVKRKVLIGAVSFKKADEKKDSFKRSSLVGRRRDNSKTKTNNDTTNNSGMELLSPNVNDGFDTYKPFSSENHSGMIKKIEPSDSFDTYKPSCKNTESDIIRKEGSNVASQRISTGRTSLDSSDSCISPAADSFDTSKTTEGACGFDNYKPVSVVDSGDAASSSFDTYKPASGPCLYIRGYDLIADSLRNVFSKYGVVNRVFVEERQKSAFITYATTEEAEAAIKEMDGNMVNGITLRVSFARRQNQCGDSGRFRSGKSFDRNSVGDERGGSGRSNHSWGERNSRFRGNVRLRGERGGRGRGRGRTYESADSLHPTASTENNDDFWPGANKGSGDNWSSAEIRPRDKDDFWSAGKQSPEKTSGWRNVERNDEKDDSFDTYKSTISVNEKNDFDTGKPTVVNNKDDEWDGFDTYKSTVSVKERNDFNTWKSTVVNNKDDEGDSFDTYKSTVVNNKDDEGDNFDTYKSTVSVKERNDFNTWKSAVVNNKGDDFDTYRPFDNNGKSGSSATRSRGAIDDNSQENFGKKHGYFGEHIGDERRHNSSDDRYNSFRGDGRGSRMSRRGSRNRGGPSWQPRKRKNESKDVDHCSIRDESGDKNDFWPSSVCHTSAQNKNDSNSRENKLQERVTSSHQSSNKSDEPWVVERSGEDQLFRGSTGRNHRSGRRGENRGGGFRRQRRNFDSKITWPDDEKGKLPCYDEWPDNGSKPSSDSWPTLSDDKMRNSLPPPPPISEVQIAWSEATKKTSKQMAATMKGEETVTQHKPEIRTQVSYAEDDPFA
ncbi:unnamed protein product [Onchocerca ochengi]|uniref:Negative elongation factor E n=1 Tax=Onchocerca ochengi TaxID=42157 RepID=A0A182E9E9_ONCOC|nr:unnamed protein product [Onchocerca ochengi]